MSIRVEGTLLVKKIQSRNGPFCIGDLITEIGEFKVKDSLIDQFDEGRYKGNFWISSIFPSSYFSFGKAIIEVRAKLADLQIDDEDDLPQDNEKSSEPDPADESSNLMMKNPKTEDTPALHIKANSNSEESLTSHSTTSQVNSQANSSLPLDKDIELFGEELYEFVKQKMPIKLDPTIDDRKLFRLQRDRLRELEYMFDAKSQTWSIRDMS